MGLKCLAKVAFFHPTNAYYTTIFSLDLKLIR
jgi:hypothetical protein